MKARVRCPTCKRVIPWEENPFRPFCSERCKLIDLGSWLGERYRIAGEEGLVDEEQGMGREEGTEGNGGPPMKG
ncbi:MAG: DNA gyrase inhibitor YacG [Nitrospinota bacterium]|nr:MAG: DNA gyrase inhibitor YacG [Nitrospinota bacterium]